MMVELDAPSIYVTEEVAAANPEEKFELVFRGLLERLFVERMDQNEEIFVRYVNDLLFRDVVSAWLAAEAYQRLRAASSREKA